MLSFLIYFFVLVISTAGVLFGLDLVTSPLPPQPNVPIGRTVQISPQPQQPQKQAKQQKPPSPQADRQADERALTPVYPASPTLPPQPRQPTPKEAWMPPPESGAAPAVPAAPAKAAPSSGPTATPNVGEAAQPPEPAATSDVAQMAQQPEPVAPAEQQASAACNLQVCAAAHPSFRPSDCTYLTYRGVRRACTVPAGAMASAEPHASTKPRVRQPGGLRPATRRGYDPDMSEAERIVRQMTRDSETDIPVLTGDGDIIIVRKSYR
jgi:hypothetical protein